MCKGLGWGKGMRMEDANMDVMRGRKKAQDRVGIRGSNVESVSNACIHCVDISCMSEMQEGPIQSKGMRTGRVEGMDWLCCTSA